MFRVCCALQMVGRAGRPQFDTEGVAVIMTQKQAGLPLGGLHSQKAMHHLASAAIATSNCALHLQTLCIRATLSSAFCHALNGRSLP